jgi:predicted Zn finger-like uncharacterized protein
MAIVTLCPQCQTGFIVQPEHLSAADGWVRCGRCSHLFAVDRHLYEMDDPRPVQEFIQPLSNPSQMRTGEVLPRKQTLPAWNFLLLALGLIGVIQIAVFQRHQWAARVPEISPVLRWLCEPLECELKLLIDPEQVSLEASSFKRVKDNSFVFEGVVRNLGDAELAAPALELSLTSHGVVSVRKVISATQLGLVQPIAARRNYNFSFHFVLAPALAEDIDGFKALLFYP